MSARVETAAHGHDYGAPGTWRMCACGRSLPSHVDTAPDPAGGEGCAMGWRLCARCGHIDERHITDHDRADDRADDREVQPGGHLRQDVPAGLGLPDHHQDSEEKPMVEPSTTPVGGAP